MEDVRYVKTTHTFKNIKGEDLHLDVLCSPEPQAQKKPTILFFHGGYVITGDRHGYPRWLPTEAIRRGWTFISADYRCLPESTGHEVIVDCVDAYLYVSRILAKEIDSIDNNRIILAGGSGGGYCAVACAQQLIRNYNHSQRVASRKNDKSAHFPRPAAVLALYPMVDLLSSWWTAESHEDSTLSAKKLVSVQTKIRRRIADEDFSFGETFAETDEEVYEQPRWEFVRYILQSATFADHLTGIDGLCEKLASKSTSSSTQIHEEKASSPESYEQLKIDLVPENARKLFPVDFDNMSSEFPPLFVVHGQSDRDVPLEDSKVLVSRCRQSNVPVQYWWLEGLDHCFDFEYGDLENSTVDINDVGLVGLKSIVSALESLVGI